VPPLFLLLGRRSVLRDLSADLDGHSGGEVNED
jgi:hypothetical protein